METYLVFEKVPASRDYDGRAIDTPVPNFVAQCVTVVEATDEDAAVRIVMGATRRMGEVYAVVPCKVLTYLPDNEVKNRGGILKSATELNAGEAG